MKGVDPREARKLLKDKRLLNYALEDARLPCELWLKHSDKWPEHERLLSAITVQQGEYGIQIDPERIEQGIETLNTSREQSVQQLPWHQKGKPPSSPLALAEACRELGIPPPPSTAVGNPACDEWTERYGQRAPWIDHIRDWRKTNRMIRVLETMHDRCRPDGSLPFSLKYFGAIVTGRWSGDAGLNLQNFNRFPLNGVDPRSCLVARSEHKLILADLSQIEPRVLAWFVGDFDLLDKIRNGLPIYQAHAEASMGFTGKNLKEEDLQQYLLAKCRVIGLGYGAGAKTFKGLAKSYGLSISFYEAKATVDNFRKANPRITTFWCLLEKSMREHDGQTFCMRLPSGRVLRYFDVDTTEGLTASTEMGGRAFDWYGGKLTENIVQATARDVFAEGILRIHKAGIRILWTVHDEVICEVPKDSDVTPDTVVSLLAQTPEWMPGLAVDAEGKETQAYCK
jgi:DNA polymerase I-like protein with 3'-5' exonuclease and polymerase domains